MAEFEHGNGVFPSFGYIRERAIDYSPLYCPRKVIPGLTDAIYRLAFSGDLAAVRTNYGIMFACFVEVFFPCDVL